MPRLTSLTAFRRRFTVSAMIATLGLGLLGVVPVGAQSSSPSASPAPLTPLWTAAGPTAAQTETWAPAIDPATGDIWVAASYDSTFWIFGPDGTYKESWGTPGTGPGQFAFLTTDQQPSPFGSIAFAPDGSFFVADVGNFRVQAYDSDRNFLRQWGAFGTGNGQFARAWSIATDGTTVYVGDDGRDDIQAFDTNGTYLRTITGADGSPWAGSPAPGFFTLDPTGQIVTVSLSAEPEASGELGVTILDPVTGHQVAHHPIDIPGVYLGLAVDAAGNTFVNIADPVTGFQYIALVELDPTGATVGTWSTAGETVAVAPDDSTVYLGGFWPDLRVYAFPKP